MLKQIRRHKTAINRAGLSRPVRLARDTSLITQSTTVFDYGCGKGGDIAILSALGVASAGWDPVHCPNTTFGEADVVNLGYVVNVIEDPLERAEALRHAWQLSRQLLVVSALLVVEAKGPGHSDFNAACLPPRHPF